jgi:hypothetical protein
MSATSAPRPNATPADDLLWQAKNIARFIGKPERATFHLLKTGALPARRVGGRWVASKSELHRHFETAVGK